jgi:hypothetical protein
MAVNVNAWRIGVDSDVRRLNIGRRSFLKGLSVAAILLGAGAFQSGHLLAQPRFPDDPFKLVFG